MAYGLVPLAMRMNLDAGVRLALILLCDIAVPSEADFIATASDRVLAAMLGTTESAARKLRTRLVEAGFVKRGRRQSQWLITIPGKAAINDVVRGNYVALGGTAAGAPVIGKEWRIERRDEASKPTGKAAEKAHGGAVSLSRKSPWRPTKKPMEGRTLEPSNKGLQRTTENSGAGPVFAPEDFEQLGSGDAAEGWLAGKGLRGAAKQGPTPNDDTGAAPPAGDLSGMIG
ncbi:hypothetical protein D769_04354 [Cupriavidus sp. HMR-1]|uniref:helix-turn-helix domain-containing protein n=1 Tax=Cupriavidus sp. HMR-1 TaxID=1249621 RepID=UPI0002A45A77|nr:helix-turn-helix domain-containing protein [Cupriavidus sp. HMR-1]ELA00631.1 hypothetical protein D769_04354 [Cupriavidus sp. HMR-1]